LNLSDELLAAAQEVARERVVTQAEWSRALVDGWQKNRALGRCVAVACGFEGVSMSDEDWNRARAQIDRLMPPVGFSSMKNPVRAWMAGHARRANDALWDGRIDAAIKLVAQGGKSKPIPGRAEARREGNRPEVRGRLVIGFRARDKGTDWNTCK